MAMTLGGRAAEELVFDEITTGASNDLEKVTATAKQMVMRFGMSDKLGPRVFGHDHGQPFLGREFSTEPDYSDEIAREIDDEVRRIIEDAHQRARDDPQRAPHDLHRISQILIERETIEKEQFERLLAGESEDEVFGADEPSAARAAGAAGAVDRRRTRARPARARCPAPASPEAPPELRGVRRAAPTGERRMHLSLDRCTHRSPDHGAAELPRHGGRQRDARLVLRRRAVPRRAARRSRTGSSSPREGARFSTSAASRRGPARAGRRRGGAAPRAAR